MANPNIVNVANIYGKINALSLTTSNQTLISNAAASGKIVKVNSIIVANTDGANAADCTLTLSRAAGASTFFLAHTITVPGDSNLVLISKDTSIYLEEDDSILALASAAGDLDVFCSYEEIS